MKQASLIIVLVAACVLSSCCDFVGFDRFTEDFHHSYPFQPGGSLRLENTNGSVEIAGWDRNSVDVSATKFASNESDLREINIKVTTSGDEIHIWTEFPHDFLHGSQSVRYVIRVPSRITLAQAKTTNGTVTVEDLQGGGRVSTTNGRISMSRDVGDYVTETTNGTIEFEECSGLERAGTVNGAVRGRLKSGAIDSHSTNGSIDVTILQPQSGQAIRGSTTNGGVTLGLAEFRDNAITAHTTHGGVTLRLPDNINARVRAQTRISHVSSDLMLSSTEEMSKHRLAGQFGSGGPLISAETTTGGIRLERY